MGTVVRRGDSEAGALFLKINGFQAGCRVFSGVVTPQGGAGWMLATGPVPVPEKDADAYLARQIRYDADLWIVEIEDPKGTFDLLEPLVDL
jgi:GMP synthase (glutamine-hydrolysing)